MRFNSAIRLSLLLGAALLLRPSSTVLRAQQAHDLAPFFDTNRAAVIALARSAAPAAVSDSASVLMLTKHGFEEVAMGTNGFTCFTLAGFFAEPGDPEFWNPRIRAPHCLNGPAMQTIFPGMRQRAEWILAGLDEATIKRRTVDAYANHRLPMPAPGAMAYMLSHHQHLADTDPAWMPHLMFYYPGSLTGSTWGAGGMGAPVIDATADDPKAPVRVLLIPVRRWSDGSPAAAGAGH